MGLRRPRSALESDLLRHRLAQLVVERQALRDRSASEVLLEQNRLEIVQTQLELSRALVSEHLAVSAA